MTIDIKSMGYARVASTDLEAWRHFGTKVLGFAEVATAFLSRHVERERS